MNRKLAVDTYARTKGERVYVLNRLGAICLVNIVLLKLRFVSPKKVFFIPRSGASNGSYENLVGSEVSKKEMARAVKQVSFPL